MKGHGWENHVLVTAGSGEEKGFLLKNETFSRFEPVGVTWNDSYCRRITNGGSLGCFVQRDINLFPIADTNRSRNNCSGLDFDTFSASGYTFQIDEFQIKNQTNASDSNGKSVARVYLI